MAKRVTETKDQKPAATTPEPVVTNEPKAAPAGRKAAAKAKSKPAAKPRTEAPRAPLMVTVSGLRGVVGDSFTPLTIAPYVDAFARLISGKRVILGHDNRPSAKWAVAVVEGILRARGIDVAHVGLVPTPTVGLLTRKLRAAGGICITASHNPVEYNGLKFFSPAGEFITPEAVDELKALAATACSEIYTAQPGKSATLPDAAALHLEQLLSVFPPPDKPRTNKRMKCIIDCCNSAGVEIAPDVVDAYGGLFQMIHADITATGFSRGAEPLPENIGLLRRAVTKEGADVGFALDPDADRLALVDENGLALGEERTLLLAADAFLTMLNKKSPIVVNLSTSRVIDDLASKHGVKVYRTAIGEANVLAGMRLYKARIGGEGNGGVIVPAVQPGRDAATGIALILMGMQANGKTLAEWNAEFPHYAIAKHKVPIEGISTKEALANVKRVFRREQIDTTDGVKVVMLDRWVHVRPSNTEPIVRIFAEAPTTEEAQELVDKAVAAL